MKAAGALLLGILIAVPATAAATDLAHARRDLRGSPVPSDRAAAAQALGAGGRESDVPALADVLLGDTDVGVRVAAATALGRLGGGRASRALSRAQTDASPVVRRAVVAALLAIGPQYPATVGPAQCGDVFAAVYYPDRDIAICSDGSFEGRMRPPVAVHQRH
jgi:HEAT repeat protein